MIQLDLYNPIIQKKVANAIFYVYSVIQRDNLKII